MTLATSNPWEKYTFLLLRLLYRTKDVSEIKVLFFNRSNISLWAYWAAHRLPKLASLAFICLGVCKICQYASTCFIFRIFSLKMLPFGKRESHSTPWVARVVTGMNLVSLFLQPCLNTFSVPLPPEARAREMGNFCMLCVWAHCSVVVNTAFFSCLAAGQAIWSVKSGTGLSGLWSVKALP